MLSDDIKTLRVIAAEIAGSLRIIAAAGESIERRLGEIDAMVARAAGIEAVLTGGVVVPLRSGRRPEDAAAPPPEGGAA